jgi:hypothetical protein
MCYQLKHERGNYDCKTQKPNNRTVVNEKREDTKYYEEIYRKRTMELLGLNNENIYGTARGSL